MLSSSALLLAACVTAGEPSDPQTQAPTEPAEAQGSRRDVTVADLAVRLEAGTPTFVLDVRTPEEFAEGHVPGAVNLPVGVLADRLAELEDHRGEEIWTICAVGGRSATAAGVLADAGFSAVNVDRGTRGWIGAGHPVE